jgi:hypothetical protein
MFWNLWDIHNSWDLTGGWVGPQASKAKISINDQRNNQKHIIVEMQVLGEKNISFYSTVTASVV